MYYLLVSFVLIIFLCFVEVRRVKLLGSEESVLNSVKKDWDGVHILFFSILFVSLISIVIIFLESASFVLIERKDFNFSVVPYLFYSILIIPVIEEYFFRFLPFYFIKDKKKVYIIGIVLSSLLFALFHRTDFNYMVFIFIMGILFSLILFKTKNLSYCIFCHLLYNLYIDYRVYFGNIDFKILLVIFGISLLVLVYKSKRRVILG